MRVIPFSPPDITEEEELEVVNALRSGWITTGPRTKELERGIAELCGTSRAVCLSSATSCMEMTLRILGIGEGDEVITTAYTYTATASSIFHAGATPVLVDTMPGSYEIDYDAIADKITEKTKAIMPVDIAGVPCDYDRLYHIIESKRSEYKPSDNEFQKAFTRVIIIADCAHGLGSTRDGISTGSLADFTCFSFHAVKNFTTAEGGAVTWRDIPLIDSEEIYKKYMLISLHGQTKDAFEKSKAGSWEYDIVDLGYKCNMTDIQAAIGNVQLRRYPGLLAKRKEIVAAYMAGIDEINSKLSRYQIKPLIHQTENYDSNCHLFLMNIEGADIETRNAIIQQLSEKGVSANVHYKPLPLLTAYKNKGYRIEEYPNAYNMYSNEITLPLHTLLSEEDVEYILDILERVMTGLE